MSPAAEHVLKLAMELPLDERWRIAGVLAADPPRPPNPSAPDPRGPDWRAEVSRLGRAAYAVIEATRLTPEDDNKYVAVDAYSGDYEVDADAAQAILRLRARRPGARCWLARAGHPAAARMRSPRGPR